MTSILFVCHGNICRSPMAEFVMKDLVAKNGLSEQVYVESAATSTEEIGNDIHRGTAAVLRREGIPAAPRMAVQLRRADYDKYDLIVGMDSANIRNIFRICGGDPEGKVRLMMSFCGLSRDVADPWYTGDFDSTYRDISSACRAMLEQI